MSKKILLCTVFIIGMLFPLNAFAQCNNSEIAKLSALAQNVTTSYDYVEKNGFVTFTITFTNLQPNLKVKDVTKGKEYYYSSNELVLSGYSSGTTYRFDIYATGNCTDKIYSHYVTLPGYNPYYKDPICEGITNSICQKWIKTNYSYEDFVKEVQKIKKENTEEKNEIENNEVLGIYDYIMRFFVDYYYIILPIIIVICIIAIAIDVKKQKEKMFF